MDNSLSTLIGQYTSDSENDDDGDDEETTELDVKPKNVTKNINTNDRTTSWTECMDPNTGHPYYWNFETKEVTWEKPIEYEDYEKYAISMGLKLSNEFSTKGNDEDIKTSSDTTNEFPDVILMKKPGLNSNKNSITNTKVRKRQKILDQIGEEKIEIIHSFTDPTELNTDETFNNKEDMKNTSNICKLSKPIIIGSTIKDSDLETCNINSKYLLDKNKIMKTESDILPNKSRPENMPATSSTQHSSFADIITGGKTDNVLDEELNKLNGELENDIKSFDLQSKINETDNTHFYDKTFKRKRRIEFKTKSSHIVANETSSIEIPEVTTPLQNMNKLGKNLYFNFVKSHVEFAKTPPIPQKQNEQNDITTVDGSACENGCKSEIDDLRSTIEAKLKYLSIGSLEITPVQVISVQLEALSVAFLSCSLDTEYFLKWLNTTAEDLIKLEQNASPEGWKCEWDRDNSQYCYTNLTTGEVQLEFPQENDQTASKLSNPEIEVDDDEMDISTTPPPNENEQIKYNLLPTPLDKQSSGNSGPNDINCELACFYSDIANLDSSFAATETSIKSSVGTESSVDSSSLGTGVKRKRNKIKVQGLGCKMKEVTTMVANWQKAQKELDD